MVRSQRAKGEYVLVLAGGERAAENAVDLSQGVAMVLERRSGASG